MKRKIALLISILSLTILMLLPVQAAGLDLVFDEVGVLTGDEHTRLNELAQDIVGQYDCEISIVVVEDKGDEDVMDFAKSIYKEYDYGYGNEKSGIMLLLSMAERDHALIAYGYGNTVLTDHGRDVLLNKHVLPRLGGDEYYEGFLAYLNQTAEFLQMAEEGVAFDVNTERGSQGFPWVKLAIFFLAPILIAGAVCMVFYSQMKTAVSQRAADNYIPKDSFNLTMQADHFLYATEIRTKIAESSSSGGTSVGGDGFSGSSGKF